jgi:NLR family CARD domain-containing protein 3
MYLWYNAALRGFPAELHAKLEGNRYETTIFCIISGIIKLARLTEVPVDRRLYRGLGGMVLPDAFWGSKDGFRGGVETGLMSTTTDRRVAMQYSGKDGKRSTVFEILAGRVDIGADLSWVSQYPGEKEVPLTSSSCTCICMC